MSASLPAALRGAALFGTSTGGLRRPATIRGPYGTSLRRVFSRFFEEVLWYRSTARGHRWERSSGRDGSRAIRDA